MKVGDQVIFKPKCLEDYTLDGVQPGDKGYVTNIAFHDDVMVSLVRQDGSVCENFLAFTDDVQVLQSETVKQKMACLSIVGNISMFSCEDFTISFIGEEYNITMKDGDPGGYKKVKAQRLIDPLMRLIKEDY